MKCLPGELIWMFAYLYNTIKKLSLFRVPALWCTKYDITTELISYLKTKCSCACKILGIRFDTLMHSFNICMLSSLENSWSAAEIFFFITDQTVFQRLRQALSYALLLMETWGSDTASCYRVWEGPVFLEDKVFITIDEPFQLISSCTTSGTVMASKSFSKYIWIWLLYHHWMSQYQENNIQVIHRCV